MPLLALLGFDVMRYVLRVVLPLSLALTGVLLALYLASDDPRFAVHRVFRSPDQHFTWVGFATYVTVMCGASLTLVTNVADVCRYTRSRRDMRIALFGSAVTSAVVTTFIGGYAAAATGESNPFVAVAGLTDADAVLVLVLVAIVVQSLAVNVTNVYTAGLSLVNSAPALGRFRASVLVAGAAIVLSGFPGLRRPCAEVDRAPRQRGGAVDRRDPRRLPARPAATVDVAALYEPHGRYRFLRGVNAAAVGATAVGRRCVLRRPTRVGEGRLGRSRRRRRLCRARGGATSRRRTGSGGRRDEDPVGGMSPEHEPGDEPDMNGDEYVLDTPRCVPSSTHVHAAVGGASSPETACDAIRPYFAELLADPEWLAGGVPRGRAGERDGRRYRPVAALPRGRRVAFAVLARDPARRRDAGPRPSGLGSRRPLPRDTGRGDLRAANGALELVERRALEPGDFYALIPPTDDIHRVRTTSAETSVSIHLLTNDTGCVWRHAFDPDSGDERPFRSGYVNVACEGA